MSESALSALQRRPRGDACFIVGPPTRLLRRGDTTDERADDHRSFVDIDHREAGLLAQGAVSGVRRSEAVLRAVVEVTDQLLV